MYMDTVEGYEGEKEIITRFGLEIRDETTFTVSRRRWLDLVSHDANLISTTQPNEGDWIYMPTQKRLFEISFVDIDDPFYQVDNIPVYKLYARTVEYSMEDLDTGVADIDAIETKYSTDALDWQFLGEQSSTTTFNQQIAIERGTYSGAWPGSGVIQLQDATDGAGSMLLGENQTGFSAILTEDSDSYYAWFIISEDFRISTLDTGSDNEYLNTQATAILDFSESNPFFLPTDCVYTEIKNVRTFLL